jgi:hypothetical protein
VAHFERNACGDAHLSGPSLNEYVSATSLIDGFSIVLKGVFVGCGRITANTERTPVSLAAFEVPSVLRITDNGERR